jgi:hypothetical protein
MRTHTVKDRNKFLLTLSVLNSPEQIPDKRQPLTTGGTKTAGFPDKKIDQI